jgi:uncharacterized protein YggE
MRIAAIAAAAGLIAGPAIAQSAAAPPTVNVTGHGKLSIPPDTANIHYWLRGEGKTPDEATRAMVAAQTNVENGIHGLLGASSKITNSNLVVIEVRDPACKNAYGQATISEGQCAIIGYLATSETDVRTSDIAKAGTAVGLASRLGARDARLLSFELRDTADAQRRAMAVAVNDARGQAMVLANAAGGHLGRALVIQFGSYMSPFVSGSRINSQVPPAPPPPPPPPPPVQVDVKPAPQDVTADVSVSYELLP